MAVTFAFTYNVQNYGAYGNGTDQTVPIQNALADARNAVGGAGMLYFPSATGTYVFTTPLTLNYVSILGDGTASTLVPHSPLSTTLPFGSGPAIIVGNTTLASGGVRPILEKFNLQSPLSSVRTTTLELQTTIPPYGFSPSVGDGIWVVGDGQPFINNVTVTGFDKGVFISNTSGNTHFDQSIMSNNFYGVYFGSHSVAANHYSIRDSGINGNVFANIGIDPYYGVQGLYVEDSHIGYAPFGVFQEPTTPQQLTTGAGIGKSRFVNADFEQIGNAAIYAENQFTTIPDLRGSGDIHIIEPGFSWNTLAFMPGANTPTMSASGYYYLGKSRNYCMQLGLIESTNDFLGYNTPFVPVTPTPGFVNTFLYHFHSAPAQINIQDDFTHLENILIDSLPNGSDVIYTYRITVGPSQHFPSVQQTALDVHSTLGFAPVPIMYGSPVKGLTFPYSGGGVGFMAIDANENRLYIQYNNAWKFVTLTAYS